MNSMFLKIENYNQNDKSNSNYKSPRENALLKEKILTNNFKREKIKKKDFEYIENKKKSLNSKQLYNQRSLELFKSVDYSYMIKNKSNSNLLDTNRKIEVEFINKNKNFQSRNQSKLALEEYIKNKNYKKKAIPSIQTKSNLNKDTNSENEKEHTEDETKAKNNENENFYTLLKKNNYPEFLKLMEFKTYDEIINSCSNFTRIFSSKNRKSKRKNLSPIKKRVSTENQNNENKKLFPDPIKSPKQSLLLDSNNLLNDISNKNNDFFLTSEKKIENQFKIRTSLQSVNYQDHIEDLITKKHENLELNEDEIKLNLILQHENNRKFLLKENKSQDFYDRRLLQIYKESPEIKQKLKNAMKNKYLSLEDYQKNLLEILVGYMSTESIISLSNRFKEIRELITKSTIKEETNKEFNSRLLSMVREKLQNFNTDIKSGKGNKNEIMRNSVKDVLNVNTHTKNQNYKIGFKREQSIDKIKNFVPGYLFEKLKSIS